MSEHRASASVKQNAKQLLNAKRCQLWPNCACKPTLAQWQNKLTDSGVKWNSEKLSWAEISFFLTLSCVSECCPSPKYRAYAQVQLLNPFWNRQRLGVGLAEFCERMEESNDER